MKTTKKKRGTCRGEPNAPFKKGGKMSKYKQLMLMVPGLVKQENKVDFYCSLSVQGIYQTVCVAEKMKEDSCENPEYIFTSTSLYARQTAEIMCQTFPKAILVFRDNLYAANEKNLLRFLTRLDDIFGCLLVLSESQTVQKLLVQLTGQLPDLPASTCICIQWPNNQPWKTIGEITGQLTRLWLP